MRTLNHNRQTPPPTPPLWERGAFWSNLRLAPLSRRGGAGGGVLTVALFLFAQTTHAQQLDTTEYTLRVAAKKTINNSTVDGKAGFSEYKSYPTRTIAQLRGFVPATVKLSKYGGRLDRRTKATGYFHVEKINGRWWAVDPEGYYFLQTPPTTCSPAARSALKKR